MKKVYIFGQTGQLGKCLLETKPEDFAIIDTKQICLTSRFDLIKDLRCAQPDIVINAAAANGVDSLEDCIEYGLLVNGVAPITMYTACKNMASVKFVHISSDFVFGSFGVAIKPVFYEYSSQEPENIYGFTKHVSDWIFTYLSKGYDLGNTLMLRTSWLFSEFGDNFLTKMIDRAKSSGDLYGADDVFGSPTYARDLAKAIWLAIERDAKGVYNVTNSGSVKNQNVVNKFKFINEILMAYGANVNLMPTSVKKFKLKANRPLSTALNCENFYSEFGELRNWKDAVNEAVGNYRKNESANHSLQ